MSNIEDDNGSIDELNTAENKPKLKQKFSIKEKLQENLWTIFGQKLPESEVVFFAQIAILYLIIACSIYNLSVSKDNNTLWISLLSSCLGYMLPQPTLKRKLFHSSKNER